MDYLFDIPASIKGKNLMHFIRLHAGGIGVSLAVAAAVFFSLNSFLGQGIRFDEAESLWAAGNNIASVIQFSARSFQSPLYLVILNVVEFFVGGDVVYARMLSMVFFLASVVLVYLIGRDTYSAKHGFFAAALFALSPFMNWYGNEARMYSLFSLLILLNQYFFLKARARGHQEDWWAYSLTALLGLYTHYFFVWAMVVQAAFVFFWSRATFRQMIMYALIPLIAFLPWAAGMLLLGNIGAVAAQEAPTSVSVFTTFSRFLFGFNNDHINTILMVFWPVAVLLGFLSLGRGSRPPHTTIFFLLNVLIPVAGVFLFSLWLEPLFISRYLILTLPSLSLFLAAVIFAYPERLRLLAQSCLVALTVLFLGVEAWSASVPVKENYYQASFYLQENAGPGDVVAVSSPSVVFPLEYYYRGRAPVTTIPAWDILTQSVPSPFSQQELDGQSAAFTRDYRRLWLLVSQNPQHSQDVVNYFDRHFPKVYQKQFSPDLNLYVYNLQK